MGTAIEPRSADEVEAHRRARRSANQRIAFLGHALIWATTTLFLAVVAGFTVAVIVALAWGIGLTCHGFFGVVAPRLRARWMERELEAQLVGRVRETRRELRGEHVRSLAELSASIAHEVRNPITAAKSLVQQMGEDPGSEENLEYARIAIEELDRVEKSVSHLLRYAREQDVQMTDVDPNVVVEDALGLLSDRIESAGVTVRRDLSATGSLRGDPEKLRQVVLNLAGNALDALDGRSSPELSVATGNDLAGRELWLRVQDNGPGVPEDVRSKIFSPFFTAKEGGTGLGLAITKNIVEAHGGSIEVERPAGGGTAMAVRFPVR